MTRGGFQGRGKGGFEGGPWHHIGQFFNQGPGFPFGGGPPFARGRKAKRGDVRAAILALLAEEPRNGYQIIQEIGERSHGAWRPSPGAVYPALQQLADEGLVIAAEGEGRKTFRLTEAGQAYVAEHADEVNAPWEAMTPHIDEGVFGLFDLARQAGAAMVQVAHSGNESQVEQAKQVLIETRRKLYQILADGGDQE
ncbi:PadR family transcriptional regulator [Rhizohabitans arisaemae]|uniref:PadR family transcriptional regulator n=1 Tax=Rhizohabitans arisaemae TaxID=2720610 RepID=UPI0024B0D264|nr:PadR family transcriptional regulator [Rhizohabitans arisaemae]